jgi:hypothetical protein
MAFKPTELGHDQNHGIVRSNEPILCTCLYLVMAINLGFGGFNFTCTKNPFFLFSKRQKWFFKHLKSIQKLDHPKI